MVAVVALTTEPVMSRYEQEDLLKEVQVQEHTPTTLDMNTEKDDGIVVEQEDYEEDLNMVDEDVVTPKSAHGEVVIYESGKPVLKVESGTTLEVVKLLYESEHTNRTHIIGVRPKLDSSDIPCIVTRQESKLNETAYDLITKERRPPTPPLTPQPLQHHQQIQVSNIEELKQPQQQQNSTETTRCIECLRDSLKTRGYRNVGMNTEVSINPLTDVQSNHSITGNTSASAQTNGQLSQNAYQQQPPKDPPKRGRPPLQRAPNYAKIHSKEYMVAPVPVGAIPVPVSEMEYHGHYRRRSPRGSPIHLFPPPHSSKMYQPPSKVDLDSVPYETIRSIPHPPPPHHHHMRRLSPPHPRMMKVVEPSERHSPPARRPRSRSPPIYKLGYMKEEPRDFYRHHFPVEEKPRLHASNHNRPRFYPSYEVPPPSVIPAPTPIHSEPHPPQEATHPSPDSLSNKADTEPPVYVLPEDFNTKLDRFDPNILSQSSPGKTTRDKKNESELSKSSQSNESSPSSFKSNDENHSASGAQPQQPQKSTTPPTNNPEHKLSCKICKKSFPTKSTLYKHLRGHPSEEKPFKCDECGQGFTLSSNLRQHRIIHRGYKPFQCEYCGKKFMRSNVYKQHRRIHTGEQMHKCEFCPSEFLQKYALVKHLKKTHNIDTYEN